MMRKNVMASEKKHGKHKNKVKRAQETNDDTSELITQSRDSKKYKSPKEKDITMHKLTGLVEAAKIVENSPSTEGKPGRRKSRNPQKTMTAVVKPTQKSGKGIKKMKDHSRKQSSNSDVDVEDSESSDNANSTDEESYDDLKKKMSVLLSKLEKIKDKKKNRQRKRKNKKGKIISDEEIDEDDEIDVRPPKSQKKMNYDNSDKKSKETNEVTTAVAPDNSMIMQLQYQQMMMQQMYMTFMQQPYNFPQPYGMPHMMPSTADPNFNPVTAGSSNTAMIIPGTSILKSTKSSSTITAAFSEKQKLGDNYVNVDINSRGENQKQEKKSKNGHHQNDEDSDASEVYEPNVMLNSEQKQSEENSTIVPQLQINEPTPSFLRFCDMFESDEKENPSKSSKPTKEPTISEEQAIVSEKEKALMLEDTRLNSVNKDTAGGSIADLLLHILPPQVRKEVDREISENKDSEDNRSEINSALRRIIQTQQSSNDQPINRNDNNIIKQALQRLLSDDKSANAFRNINLLPFEPKPVKHGPPPLENHIQERKSYSDSDSWMRDCLHNLYLQDQDGDTILHILIAKEDERGAIEIIKKMKGYRMDILNALGQTPLHLAMYIKSTKIIEALLHHGADVSIVDAHGNSPLHIACEENSFQMVQVLFEYQMSHRAKYEKIKKIKNNQGLTAIHISTLKENENILKFLVHHEVDLDTQEGRSGNTPLVMALSKGNWGLAEFFMESGANVNIPNFSNCYPLHFAVQGNKMEMVKKLLNAGAEMGSKANEYDNGKDSEIKTLLAKEMRKRRRQKARAEEKWNH